MTICDIKVDVALRQVRQQLKEDRTVSRTLRAAIDMLMLMVKPMADRPTIRSRESCKLPSQNLTLTGSRAGAPSRCATWVRRQGAGAVRRR
jgi:hypothetical protein